MTGRFFFQVVIVADVLAIAFSLGFSQRINSGARGGTSPLQEHLREQVPIWMERYDIPGLVLGVLEDGELSWQEAFGYADLDVGRLMEENTMCRVESISKSVTAWGVMKLVEEGTIELDSPVVHYLKSWSFPESDFPVEKITVRHLLSNSSGLPLGTIGERYAPGAPKPSLKERLSKDAVLQNMPGSAFSYSNTGFNLLELLIEEVTGREFAAYMEQEVLLPLGMQQASFEWRANFPSPVPLGYDPQGKPIPVYVYPDKASGGLFATATDIARFVAAGMPDFSKQGLNVLSRESMDLMYTAQVEPGGFYGLAFDGYGFGHFVEQLSSGEKAVAHGGQGSGWMTHFHAVPEAGDGIVILTNSQRSWPLFSLVLREWVKARGTSGLGMGIITTAKNVLWVIIWIFFLVTLLSLVYWWRGLSARRRIFAPLHRWNRPARFLQAVSFLVLVYVLTWAKSQPYLFLSSIFPFASKWLGVCMTLIIVTLFVHILFPRIKPGSRHEDK